MVASTNDGMDLLKQRVTRRTRAVPPPRRPRAQEAEEVLPQEQHQSPTGAEHMGGKPQEDLDPAAIEVEPGPQISESRPAGEKQATLAPRRKVEPKSDYPVTQPDEPLANLAIRVRHSLDSRLGDLAHSLKREGIRTSKAELVEMLLWELPATHTEEFRRRLAVFRRQAPRERSL